MNTPTKLFLELFNELNPDEVIRIELMNGAKLYCLPSDNVYDEITMIKIIKSIKDKKQIIIIDVNAIALVCTMSRQTYELKLKSGELYV